MCSVTRQFVIQLVPTMYISSQHVNTKITCVWFFLFVYGLPGFCTALSMLVDLTTQNPRMSIILLSQVPVVADTSASSFSCTILLSRSSWFCRRKKKKKKKSHFNLGTAIHLHKTDLLWSNDMTSSSVKSVRVFLSASKHILCSRWFSLKKTVTPQAPYAWLFLR